MAIEYYGVAGIVPAGIARRVVEGRSEVIDDLPFSFVAPLRADYRDCFRPRLLGHPEALRGRTSRTLPAPVESRNTTGRLER